VPRKKARYIVVEGPIGVGKTTLAEMLAAKLDAKLVLENADDNPFLHDFYGNIEKNAFQTQIFFLLSRWKQQQEFSQMDLFHDNLVVDYLFEKNRIFANLTLPAVARQLYDQIYEAIVRKPPLTPDLVIYLYASVERLIERVNKRAKRYEQTMTPDYLREAVRAYNDFFFNYADAPLLMVNTESIDFVENPNDFVELFRKIDSFPGGVHHFNPESRLPLPKPKK